MQRLFFALWPDSCVRDELAAASARLPDGHGRPVAADNYHITLLFVGAADVERRQCLTAAADGILEQPFVLPFGQWGYWQRSAVVWLAPNASPPALLRLVAGLRTAAADCGLSLESRPFRPHVTLARKATRIAAWPRPPRFQWPVGNFVLCQSLGSAAGVRYEVLKRWPLMA